MPSLPVVFQPGLCQVRTQYSVNPDTGDHPENVLWFKSTTTTAPTIANLTSMAAHFDAAWDAVYTAYGGSNKVYTGSIWTDFSSSFGLSYSSVGVWSSGSSSHGTSMVASVSILVSLHVLERWKGGHARIYLPYVGVNAQSATDADMLTSAIQGTVGTAFAAVNGATTASGVLGGQTQQVYRQKTDPTHAHLMNISSFTVQPVFATQRRRLRKAPHH